MKISENGEGADRKGPMCPFLGLKDDPTTALSFPSSGNHCFHARPVLPVKLEFQGTHCLTANHVSCEEFIRPPDTPLLPKLRLERSGSLVRETGRNRLWYLLLGLVIVVLVVWLVFSKNLLGSGKPGSGLFGPIPPSSTPTVFAQVQATATPIVPAPTDTPQPPPTPTLTPPPPHALETPIGSETKLVIHRIDSGESLPSMASYYWTTVDAIQTVNYNLQIPLRVGSLVIIPINQTDVHGLPTFYAYQVEKDISVENLAKELSVDPSLVKRYNALKDNEMLNQGQWLVIPQEGTPTP